MKITIEFADEERARRAMRADGCYAILFDIVDIKLRNIIKHGMHNGAAATADQVKIAEDLREYIMDSMYSDGINLDADYT